MIKIRHTVRSDDFLSYPSNIFSYLTTKGMADDTKHEALNIVGLVVAACIFLLLLGLVIFMAYLACSERRARDYDICEDGTNTIDNTYCSSYHQPSGAHGLLAMPGNSRDPQP